MSEPLARGAPEAEPYCDLDDRALLGQTERMSNLKHSESIVIARSLEVLYDMVSDVTRMGQWSPACRSCWWDEGALPEVGAWFTGRNELPKPT